MSEAVWGEWHPAPLHVLQASGGKDGRKDEEEGEEQDDSDTGTVHGLIRMQSGRQCGDAR